MLVYEILNEATVVPLDMNSKFKTTLNKWLQYVKEHMNDPDNIGMDARDIIRDNRRKFEKKLNMMLLPTVRSLVKQNVSQHIKDEEGYNGHRIGVDVTIYDDSGRSKGSYTMAGSVYQRWRKTSTSTKTSSEFKYSNDLNLNASYDDIIYAMRDEDIVDRWVAVLTHELTHLMQSLRHPKQLSIAKDFHRGKHRKEFYKPNAYSSDDHYLLDKTEIDAYAQGTATRIWLYANRYNQDPAEFIRGAVFHLLKLGQTTLFNRAIFPTQDFERFKEKFMQPTSDPVLRQARQQAWKRFNKKIYEKLSEYIKQHKQQNKGK